jgi:hypothetical protein
MAGACAELRQLSKWGQGVQKINLKSRAKVVTSEGVNGINRGILGARHFKVPCTCVSKY